MIKKNFLIILTGLPASGKTMFALKLKIFLESNLKFNVEIIDPDKIRNDITPDQFDFTKEPIVRKTNLDTIQNGLNDGNIVISDDLNYYSSMRHDLKEIADSLQIGSYIIYISTPMEICIKWNEQRGTTIPNNVIYEIEEKFDKFGKYKWDNPLIKIDPSKITDFNEIFSKLIVLIESEELKEKGREIETSNLDNENLDKITRGIIGEILQNARFQPQKKELITCRKAFIKLFLNKSLTEAEIQKNFKEYLEKSLDFKFS